MKLNDILLEQEMPSIMFHGTKSDRVATLQRFGQQPVYLTADKQQAAYYAEGAHLGGTEGAQNYVLTVKKSPGKTLQADSFIEQIIMDEHEQFETIDDLVEHYARSSEYDYIAFTHPDVGEDEEHLAVVSLYPSRDLVIRKVETVRN